MTEQGQLKKTEHGKDVILKALVVLAIGLNWGYCYRAFRNMRSNILEPLLCKGTEWNSI